VETTGTDTVYEVSFPLVLLLLRLYLFASSIHFGWWRSQGSQRGRGRVKVKVLYIYGVSE